MRRFLIILATVALIAGLSHHAWAHPGHGYYIEEPSDSGDSKSDSSTTSDSSSTSNKPSGQSSSKTSTSGGHKTTHESKLDSSDSSGKSGAESSVRPEENVTDERENTTETADVNMKPDYGFLPALAGLCLVFGLTAFRFPRN
ncbi:hypothetical protein ISG34_03240 [Methanothermobacter marburgensis]|uniref:Uncharacterized protein n=1 Tax=Methanothermobacter marburgensis (strain ATCC BAA-927 / DSM 2133 / JCM 14651 / NBRC 100331 / OCM 82 / Marburg) TaxID=79929 RepID=D9PVJ8_METTM|nr:hypothetical protein [Methanothermobacter marburgensis]ADL58246.1 conserved hypothetical protein [Methanothermobacter marburgensis str. Marburg]WBF10412.1 hypothetical protein ISG34_03240 [Methanothermobacter marburgensis]